MAVGDIIPKTLVATALTTTLTTQLGVPGANKRWIIEKMLVAVTGATARVVTIDRHDGANAYQILGAVSVAANTTQEIAGPIVLDSSSISLRGGQGTGTDVHVTAFGLEESLA